MLQQFKFREICLKSLKYREQKIHSYGKPPHHLIDEIKNSTFIEQGVKFCTCEMIVRFHVFISICGPKKSAGSRGEPLICCTLA